MRLFHYVTCLGCLVLAIGCVSTSLESKQTTGSNAEAVQVPVGHSESEVRDSAPLVSSDGTETEEDQVFNRHDPGNGWAPDAPYVSFFSNPWDVYIGAEKNDAILEYELAGDERELGYWPGLEYKGVSVGGYEGGGIETYREQYTLDHIIIRGAIGREDVALCVPEAYVRSLHYVHPSYSNVGFLHWEDSIVINLSGGDGGISYDAAFVLNYRTRKGTRRLGHENYFDEPVEFDLEECPVDEEGYILGIEFGKYLSLDELARADAVVTKQELEELQEDERLKGQEDRRLG